MSLKYLTPRNHLQNSAFSLIKIHVQAIRAFVDARALGFPGK